MKDINAYLNEVAVAQLTWKPTVMRTIAVRIVRMALERRKLWPSDVELDDVVKADKNCTGTAYRQLNRFGVIKQTGKRQQSRRDASNGTQEFEWRLKSKKRAKTFLGRNDLEPEKKRKPQRPPAPMLQQAMLL